LNWGNFVPWPTLGDEGRARVCGTSPRVAKQKKDPGFFAAAALNDTRGSPSWGEAKKDPGFLAEPVLSEVEGL
jgi:hypothetical protein